LAQRAELLVEKWVNPDKVLFQNLVRAELQAELQTEGVESVEKKQEPDGKVLFQEKCLLLLVERANFPFWINSKHNPNWKPY
jgi:phage-related baseplate assembly protein